MIERLDTNARWAAATALTSFARGCQDGGTLDRETAASGPFTGKTVAYPLAGEQLDDVSSGTEEWYIWAARHPGTGLFGPETRHGFRS